MPHRLAQIVKETLRKDWVVFLCLAIVAAMYWWVRAMDTPRDAVIPVLIQYTGVPETVRFADLPDTVKADVRDKGRRVRVMLQHPPVVTLDIGGFLKKDSGAFTVKSEMLRARLPAALPATASLQDLVFGDRVVRYYHLHAKTVPVVFNGTVEPESEYQLVGKPVVRPASVKIYGSKNMVAAVKRVETEKQTFGHVRDSATFSMRILPKEDIELETEKVEVTVLAERYTEIKYTLPVRVRHASESERRTIRLFPATVEVAVRIGVTHLREIKKQDINVYCNYPHIVQEHLQVMAETTNPYVTDIRLKPSEIEYLIEN